MIEVCAWRDRLADFGSFQLEARPQDMFTAISKLCHTLGMGHVHFCAMGVQVLHVVMPCLRAKVCSQSFPRLSPRTKDAQRAYRTQGPQPSVLTLKIPPNPIFQTPAFPRSSLTSAPAMRTRPSQVGGNKRTNPPNPWIYGRITACLSKPVYLIVRSWGPLNPKR